MFRNAAPGALSGVILFLGLAHRLFDFWELPLVWMLLSFMVGASCLAFFFIGGFRWLSSRLASPVLMGQVGRWRWWFLVCVSLIAGFLISWRTLPVPETYQTISITTQLANKQQVALLELKGNGQLLDVKPALRASGWHEEQGIYLADFGAGPLVITARLPVNALVTALFASSPDSGQVQLRVENSQVTTSLITAEPGNSTLQLAAGYRAFPAWLFLSVLKIADILTLAFFLFIPLFLQEIGVRAARPWTAQSASHTRSLYFLIFLALALHLINILSVPLTLNADSPGYIQGSMHWLVHGNLDGVSEFRGPGTTFLFAPMLWLFQGNAWGIKILLHLLALACVPLAYQLGWQLGKTLPSAFFGGLIAVFSPDLMYFSNMIMAEVPNMLLVLLFLVTLLAALEQPLSFWRQLATLLVGSFAVLLRSDNLLMLGIGILALLFVQAGQRPVKKQLAYFVLSVGLAILPLVWWSAHNLRLHGFFGLSNYMGEVLYDGWVYYGDARGTPFSDSASPAIRAIRAAIQTHPIAVSDKKGVATGWEIYPALLANGYSPAQAFQLLGDAARDSILKDPERSIQVLFSKYQEGLTPGIFYFVTFALPGEPGFGASWSTEYFSQDSVNAPALILLQRQLNSWTESSLRFAPPWIFLAILACAFSAARIRLPIDGEYAWAPLALITLSRIFAPLTISVAFWRYILAGWIPAQVVAVVWVLLLVNGLRQVVVVCFGAARHEQVS